MGLITALDYDLRPYISNLYGVQTIAWLSLIGRIDANNARLMRLKRRYNVRTARTANNRGVTESGKNIDKKVYFTHLSVLAGTPASECNWF